MNFERMIPRGRYASFTIVAALACSVPAGATTVWVDWLSFTAGANGGGTAAGAINGKTVTYTGELDTAVVNGTSGLWSPNSSFIGGTSNTSPSVVNDDLRMNGSSTGINTLTFSAAIVNPVFAIWSLGSPSSAASFVFASTPTLQAGGPNSAFGGSSITVSGNTVNGNEGNGVVQFTGTFTSISWTNTFENYYAFTMGLEEAGQTGGVPEPSTAALAAGALALAGLAARRARSKA
jgi:hypothetical protein